VIETVPYLELPGDAYYPSAIASAADGTLFVGGITGQVVKFTPDSLDAKTLVAPEAPPNNIIIPGILVDDSTATLWVCANNFQEPPLGRPAASARAYDFDGNLKASYPLPNQGTSICTDLELDDQHDLYITEEVQGVIEILKDGSPTIEEWVRDPLLAPDTSALGPDQPPFGGHNMAFVREDGAGFLYVTNWTASTLLKVPMSSGPIVQQAIAAAPPGFPQVTLANPEAVHAIDASHLVGVMGRWGVTNTDGSSVADGVLIEYVRDAADTWHLKPLRNGLRGPAAVARSFGNYWVTETQAYQFIRFAFEPDHPAPQLDLPFKVQRITATAP
jgi:hypothetical protein